jgi:hypothetical protein
MPAGRLRPGLLPFLASAAVAVAPSLPAPLAAQVRPATRAAAAPASRAARVPTPSEALGLAIGADRVLADWPQVQRYFATLARVSPAVKLDTIGRTSLGAPMIVATISTPANIRRLPQILATQARLADPRGLSREEADRLARTQPAILWVNCNLHSTEIGSSQFAMEFAHALATADSLQRTLEDVVVALVPSANPDGMQLVVEWYRQGVGTPFEGGPMPWLYHKYVGHDNNRDWYMVTQTETKHVTDALYRTWRPNIFWDVHQQGSNGMRLTVPPHVDPINPNVDSRLVRGINLIGHSMAFALEQAGKTGVGDGVTYDLWWHGGARSTPTRHNMVGVLTEAASARIATPIELTPQQLTGAGRGLPRYQRQVNFPSPWPGGTWRLRDIMDYEMIAGVALVKLAASQREAFHAATLAVARDMIAKGTGQRVVIPRLQRDPGAAAELVAVLRRGAVEVDSVDGAWLVKLDQPYAAHARDLLEVQRWPASAGDRPYDVAGWTLPFQMGVDVTFDSTGRSTLPATPPTSAGGLRVRCEGNVVRPLDDSRAWQWTFDELRAGRAVRVRRFTSAPSAAATVVEPAAGSASACTAAFADGRGGDVREATTTLDRLPRIGLYKPWTASMDEGWTRWLLDQRGIAYVTVTDSLIKAGGLASSVDVLVIADMTLREAKDGLSANAAPARYAGGLGDAGLAAIATFVQGGGRVVTFDKGSEVALAAFGGAPVRRVAPAPRRQADGRARDDTSGTRATAEVVAPGSILRTVTSPTHALASGLADTVGVYFTNSSAFDVAADAPVSVVMRYHPDATRLLMSGYLAGGESIAGKAAVVDWKVGSGRATLIGFRPQYRGQSWGTFKLLYSALLGLQ